MTTSSKVAWKIEPGKVYDLLSGRAIEPSGLPLGAIVSYWDRANPLRHFVVVEETGNQYGQRVVSIDADHESRTSLTDCETAGGFEWNKDQPCWNRQAIDTLVSRWEAKKAADAEAREQAKQLAKIETEAARAAGLELFWKLEKALGYEPKSMIVAEYHVDDCDGMSDYYATKKEKTVLLAFSKHDRDLFAEMRKAAAKFDETKSLATAGPEAEHRHKYSMGDGYFLSHVGSYRTGWRVRKDTYYFREDCMLLLGRGHVAPYLLDLAAGKVPEKSEPLYYPEWSLNEEKQGVEIKFPDKPEPEVLARLKTYGFRWSKFQGLWWAKQSPERIAIAKELAAHDGHCSCNTCLSEQEG